MPKNNCKLLKIKGKMPKLTYRDHIAGVEVSSKRRE